MAQTVESYKQTDCFRFDTGSDAGLPCDIEKGDLLILAQRTTTSAITFTIKGSYDPDE